MTEMELDRICERCIKGDCKNCMAFGEWWRTELRIDEDVDDEDYEPITKEDLE